MRRSLSLQARVAIASALSATIVIGAIAVAFAVLLRVNGSAQLDRTLDSVVLASPLDLASSTVPALPALATDPAEPALPAASTTDPIRIESVAGEVVRARDVTVTGTPGALVSVAVPEDPLIDAIRDQQVWVAAAAVAAIAAAAGLGWLFAGRAVRPLQRLASGMRTVGDSPGTHRPDARGARESEDLADAMGQMLDRLAAAQKRTEDALGSARDFAAVSAHELRTPLTSMRTDLEVLSTMRLSRPEREEILRDLLATQRLVETTLTDLERLATGELADPADHELIDLAELVDRCVQEYARTHPGVDVAVDAPESLVVRGVPTGLRLVLDNAVTNAVRHGRAEKVLVTVSTDAGAVTVTVDDDGNGVPESERTSVFERFVRGSGSLAEGSGLGLAVVAQQADLHGGSATLTDGPLGGARLTLRLPGLRQPAVSG